MAKILVTGAGGYIGSIAAYLLLKNRNEVIGLDNYMRGFRQPLELLQKKFGQEKLRFYEKDIKEDLGEVFEKEKNIEAVIHYAALCNVGESEDNPQLYLSNNAGGCEHLLEEMLKYRVRKIVFSSTCAVYGESQYIPVDENHPINPISPYGESKKIAEKKIQEAGRSKGLKYVILRYFNVCGASDDSLLGDSKKPSFHLMQNAVRGALGIEDFKLTYPQVDTPDKSPIRDYINVVDLNEAHLLALIHLLKGGENEIINLGTGTGNSVLGIIKKVEEITGKKINIYQGKKRTADPAKLIASVEKAKKVLGWEPKRSIETSAKTLVAWYTTYPNGWER